MVWGIVFPSLTAQAKIFGVQKKELSETKAEIGMLIRYENLSVGMIIWKKLENEMLEC